MASGGGKTKPGRVRRAIIAVSLLTALAAAVTFAVPRLVPSERLARRAEEALAAATGADVKVGSAQFVLAGGPGLRLRDTRIASSPDLEAALDECEISLAMAPLLRRQLVIDRVAARGPAARVVRRSVPLELTAFDLRAGHLNFRLTDPGKPSTEAAVAGGDGRGLPADIAGGITLHAARARWSSFVLDQVELKGDVAAGVLTVRSLEARCGGGRLRAAAVVGVTKDAPGALTGDLSLEEVPASALLEAWVPQVATQLDAKLTGTAGVGCDLRREGAVLATLTAQGRLTTGEGMLRAGTWLSAATPYLGDRQDLVDIRIASSLLAVRVADGRCLVDTLTITGPDTDWELAGAADLGGHGPGGAANPDSALDLAVHVRLPAGFTPDLGTLSFFAAALRDPSGRVNLDLRLRGPLSDPVVTLDLAAMSRRMQR